MTGRELEPSDGLVWKPDDPHDEFGTGQFVKQRDDTDLRVTVGQPTTCGATTFYLLVHADGKLHRGTFNRDDALGSAPFIGGVVVELPVILDCRPAEAVAQFTASEDGATP